MKHRVMVGDEISDFDAGKVVEAMAFARERKSAISFRINLEGTLPKVTVHDCYHDEGKGCTNVREI